MVFIFISYILLVLHFVFKTKYFRPSIFSFLSLIFLLLFFYSREWESIFLFSGIWIGIFFIGIIDYLTFFILWRTRHFLNALRANIIHGFPSRKMNCKFISITGTDGKTTTTEMIYHLLKTSGKKVGLITTISIDLGDGKKENTSKMTSLTPMILQKNLKKMSTKNLDYVIVEASSHALYQFRLWPIKFDAVGITNLTHEHLDFHKTMHRYFKAKSTLFKRVRRKNSIGISSLNFTYNDSLKQLSRTKKFAHFHIREKTDLYIENIKFHPEIQADFFIFWEKISVQSKIIGNFNVHNMLLASGIVSHLGISVQEIKKWLESFAPIPGRQEIIKTKIGVTWIIDFALTPHALTQLYTSISEMNFSRQIAILGSCGGNKRDHSKRPIMGELASRLNDILILTSEEDYEEDGTVIISDLEIGAKKTKKENYKIILDRKESIKYADKISKKWDVILITGMGNFLSREMNNGPIEWNEKEIILGILKDSQKI